MAHSSNDQTIDRLQQENAELRARLQRIELASREFTALGPAPSEPALSAMNQFPGVLVLYSPERRIEFANTCALNITGSTVENVIGQRDEELLPPEVTRIYLPLLQQAIATRTAQTGEFTLALPSGTRSARITYVPLFDSQDQIYQVLAIAQDISKQVDAERAVRELEERFGKAFHASPAASVISLLEDGRIVDVNDAYLALFGYTREELVGRKASETRLWVHPEDRRRVVEQIRAGHRVRSMPVLERGKTGEERELLLSAEKIEIGGMECLITHLDDVTELKRAEAQLRQSDEQFRALAEYTPDVVVRLDRDCRMTYVNPTAARLTGVPAEDFCGKSFEEMRVPRRLIPLWTEKVFWVLQHGQPTTMEFEYPTVQGPRFFETQLVPEFDPDGQVTHVLTVSRDITERARHHQELEQRVRERTAELDAYVQQLEFLARTGLHLFRMTPQEDLLSFIGEQVQRLVGDAIVAVTAYNAVENQAVLRGFYCSPQDQARLLELFGDPVGMAFTVTAKYREMMTEAELQPVPGGLFGLCFEQIPLQVCQELEQGLNIQGVYATPFAVGADLLGTVAILAHTPEPPKTAKVIDAFLSQAAIAVQRTRVLEHLQRALEDVRVLNEELARRAAELEGANKELESFAYSVSHDLRTPLATLDRFSKVLEEDFGDALPEEARQYLNQIRNNVTAMDNLIQDLLQFSRSARQPLDKTRVSVADVVHASLEALQAEREGRDIELVLGVLPDAEADPILLKQVFTNLLSNALKFTRTRPAARIEIKSFKQDGRTVYCIRDNGVGFDMEQADKLFGVFQRLHSEDEYEGTGVGLAIVSRIVRRHGGRIWAEAAVDQGAAFYFTLGQ